MDRFSILVNEKVKGYTMLAEVFNMDQRGKDVLAELVVDQDLVHVFISSTRCVNGLVQIQHAGYAFCATNKQIRRKNMDNARSSFF